MDALISVIFIFVAAYVAYILIPSKNKKTSEPAPNTCANSYPEEYSRNEMDVIRGQAKRVLDIINESVSIAKKTKNNETRISRLELANEKLKILKEYLDKYAFLSITNDGLNKLQESIDEVHDQLDSPEIRNDYLTNKWPNEVEDVDDPDTYSSIFWQKHITDLKKGEFWADKIKNFKSQPEERLGIAIENLPLPGAFHEAAIAIRTIIREKRKNKHDYQDQLRQLYWLAAVNSFYIPYAKVLKEPGFNVMAIIPKSEIKKFIISYENLGYEKLNLFNKTDIKWLKEQWGEPNNHSTLNEIYSDLWEKYELYLLNEKNKFLAGLKSKYLDFP